MRAQAGGPLVLEPRVAARRSRADETAPDVIARPAAAADERAAPARTPMAPATPSTSRRQRRPDSRAGAKLRSACGQAGGDARPEDAEPKERQRGQHQRRAHLRATADCRRILA